MSDHFRTPALAAYFLIQPFCTYFGRVSHWHPLAAMGLPIGVFFVLKALLPGWLVLSFVYTLTAAMIVLIGGMFWTCVVQPRREKDASHE